jgi:hypothetical protein
VGRTDTDQATVGFTAGVFSSAGEAEQRQGAIALTGEGSVSEQLVCEPAGSFKGQLAGGAGPHPGEPRIVADNAVYREESPGLERSHCGLGQRAEDAIDRTAVWRETDADVVSGEHALEPCYTRPHRALFQFG